jgi:hypothetical protein
MNPLEIYQGALNQVSAAVLAGDFAAFLTMFDMPYLLQTDTERLLATTGDDLFLAFQDLHQELKSRGVTHYERVARKADYVARNRIEGWHYTHLIADGARVAPPRSGRETLFLRADRWLFCEAYFPTLSTPTITPGLTVDTMPEVRS